jgi:hypothetical protein
MSDLLELIKTLKVEKDKSATSFVYYDKAGKIIKVSNRNYKEDNLEILEVPTDHVKSIINGERKLTDFRVNYDSALKSLIVKEVTWEDDYTNTLDIIYQLPLVLRGGYKKDFYKHYHFIPVYEGAKVFVYLNGYSYASGTLVYYQYNVYKTIKDTPILIDFDKEYFELYLENVVLVNKPQASISFDYIEYKNEFEGVHVDVWYKELSHVKGQHVWINNNVYMLTQDYPAQSLFDYTNSKLIVKNVKLFDDSNKDLSFDKSISVGDLILNNNQIQSIVLETIKTDTPREIDDSLFYVNSSTVLSYDEKEDLWKGLNLSTQESFISSNEEKLTISQPDDFITGQIIVIGDSFYLAKIDHSYDIVVVQNLKRGYWEIELNPRTRKYLKSSGFYPKDYVHFSLTAKHDPHILYRTFEFKLADLIEENKQVVPFKYDVESQGVELSLYTPKYFDNYAHEIVDD